MLAPPVSGRPPNRASPTGHIRRLRRRLTSSPALCMPRPACCHVCVPLSWLLQPSSCPPELSCQLGVIHSPSLGECLGLPSSLQRRTGRRRPAHESPGRLPASQPRRAPGSSPHTHHSDKASTRRCGGGLEYRQQEEEVIPPLCSAGPMHAAWNGGPMMMSTRGG